MACRMPARDPYGTCRVHVRYLAIKSPVLNLICFEQEKHFVNNLKINIWCSLFYYYLSFLIQITLNIEMLPCLVSIFRLFLIEILRISLIETETQSNANRVKKPSETSIFLWKSLEMFVTVTREVHGIRLHRFLIIAFSLKPFRALCPRVFTFHLAF